MEENMVEDGFKELAGGDIMAIRYKYTFIIWGYGDHFCGVCKRRKTGREVFRFQANTLSEAKMLCKEHGYWNK